MIKSIEEEFDYTFKSEQQKAIINLKHTSNWLSNIHHNYMIQYNLSMAQFNILRILRGAKDFISVTTIKERMIEKSPNTTRLMDKLMEKELIHREKCKNDKRVVFAKISKEGLELLAKIDLTFNDFFQAYNLSDQEAKELNALLDKMRS